MAPMDVVQAEAEEATRQQALTTATATMRTAELSLKRLIVSGTNDPLWSQHIEPTDRPDFQTVSIDVEGAVRSALQQRTDLQIARNAFEANNVLLKSQRDQSLPDVDALVTYGASGLGGVQWNLHRHRDSISSRNGILVDGGYNNALSTLFNRDYPELAVCAQRQLSDRRQRRRGAGGAHAAADSAEPGADSRERADGRHRSDQRGAAGDQQHRRRSRRRARRASCRSGGSTPR